MKSASEMTAFIRERLKDGKHRQYGEEPVSELVHALQCATLAEDEGADDELVVAALLHDFGRLVVEDGDLSDSVGGDGETPPKHGGHGELGAEQLHEHFSDRILFCIRNHAEAKRYLCTTEPEYFDGLSKGSVVTLEKQGGKMDEEERAAFESSPYCADAVRMRRWDDRGKIPGAAARSLDHWMGKVEQQIRTP
ncbi:MAG: phosphohydrolase [Gemmatimonadetes bacterium]|jgi:predicted HD phosphohydrolase|nr:phosphohydrolase [Gemmatimonadota bacterium]MDP6982975.1 HD domain-containing protein [Candidatus Latescibacterota bacterium]|tara:strand:+ start:68 stop:649 length:582 start_codon:yes stop_codon:yes gene_type:complete